jgi:hypothetical protein
MQPAELQRNRNDRDEPAARPSMMEPPLPFYPLWHFTENLCEDFAHPTLRLAKVGIKRGKIGEIAARASSTSRPASAFFGSNRPDSAAAGSV